MGGLSYSDRELLLRTFDDLRAAWSGTDDEILVDAHTWSKQIAPCFGFEHALIRDVTALSRYLLTNKNAADIAAIARGGLLYVMKAGSNESSRLGEFGLLDEAFVSSYAIHEIRTRLEEPATYNPPRLTEKEKHRAESLFLEFAENPKQDDVQIQVQAQQVGESLGNLAATGLFRRLQRNIDFLCAALGDADRTVEQKSYARAALAYVACEQDAIDDRLGIVGYFDDNFVVQMAVDLIEPSREPWLDLLDATVGAWPFLNGMFFDDGHGVRLPSEFMIINSALSCAEVRNGSELRSTVLVVPQIGPTPFLLGLVSALGLIQRSGQRDVDEASFRVGQKVLVDYCVTAEFAGFDTCDSRRMFKLRQYRTERSQRLESVHYWPISDLRRLVPADMTRVTRGHLTHDLARSDAPLPGLEYLFNASKAAELSAVTKRVLVVTPLAAAHEMVSNLRLHGHLLKDVIPMGQLTADDGVKKWSNHFGQQDPLLLFASDLDVACAFADEQTEQVELVVVDAGGRNAHRPASLRRLQNSGIPNLVVASQRTADDMQLNNGKIGVWEWEEDDFASLLWPAGPIRDGTGPIARYERRLQSRSAAALKIESVSCDLAERSFEAVRRIKTLARQRGEDQIADLEEIVSIAFGLISRLLRSATVLNSSVPSYMAVQDAFCRLTEITARSRYLTDEERTAVSLAEQTMGEFFAALQVANPKAKIVGDLLAENPRLTLICPDARLPPDLETAFSTSGVRIVTAYSDEDSELHGAIVPGWFRKERMAALLMPPITKPIHLVLYGIERKWLEDFGRERRESREARRTQCGRAKLFPNVGVWMKSDRVQSPECVQAEQDSSLRQLEEIQQFVHTGFRQRIYKSVRADGNETEFSARLVVFDGGVGAFLIESYRANVVTHLLEIAVEGDGEAQVIQKNVSQLKVGDALLFHRGSNRDVIRTAADGILPAGQRETSSLWRMALVDFAAREGLTPKQVHHRLHEAGCPLQQLTIRHWLETDNVIAPQSYERDVRAIAKLSGDAVLTSQIDKVLAAIREVRGAHLRASYIIAKQVVESAVQILKAEGETSSLPELDSKIVVVRVVEIDADLALVRASAVNRLLEVDMWHE